jgi:protein-disulfide isomerase
MPSGRASRQRRRAPVAAPPPRRRQASPRVLAGAALALVVVVAAALVLALSGGHSSAPSRAPAVGKLAGGLPEAVSVDALFKGIPQSGTTLGRASAPVTMVEYIDLQCPACRMFETTVLQSVVATYVRTGQVKLELRMWAFIGPDSSRGQAAVLAAAAQNRAFNLAALLYANQGGENTGWLDDGLISSAAASIPGLRVPELLDARSSAGVKAQAQGVEAFVRSDSVTSTPTLLVGKSGSRGATVVLQSSADETTLVAAIRRALT